MSVEDMHAMCLRALRTETQAMVRREDEQAFAELNGAHMKFIEDAARLLYEEFDKNRDIKDFEIACIHLESLHSHDAVSVICKGKPGGFAANFSDFFSVNIFAIDKNLSGKFAAIDIGNDSGSDVHQSTLSLA